MDFARKQLEKYGWTDGKGLGKNENGISQPLKPKIKRSAAGIGHDPASEFNEHWWTALYDKAAGNVEVKEKNGKTKKIKTKDDFQITNSTWKLKQKPKEENDEQYSDFFVRTAVLTKGGSKVEKVRDSESEGEEDEKKDVFKMTDEELFKACEGRTAHKGARHGLKATGKLARIAQQEALLLTESRFNGYSHSKKLKDQIVEDMNLNSDSDVKESKKKKKKRKRCNSSEKMAENENGVCSSEESEIPVPENVEMMETSDVASEEKDVTKKSKKSKRKSSNIEVIIEEEEVPTKKKKKQKGEDIESMEVTDFVVKKSKKKNKKDDS